MKKIIIILCIVLLGVFYGKTKNITSTGTGGNWGTASTWVGSIVPGSSDTATIAGPVTVSVNTTINRVTINSTKTLTVSSGTILYVNSEIINNGTFYASYGVLTLLGSNMTVMAGAGNWTAAGFVARFQAVGQVIDSTVDWNNAGNMSLISTGTTKVSVINKGYIMLWPGHVITNTTGYACSFTNSKNATLFFDNSGGTSLSHTWDTLHASAAGNLCGYVGSSYTIKQPAGNQYYNLQFQSTILIPGNLSLNNLTINSSTTLNLQGYNLNLTGNWIDNGSVSNNTGTITFQAIGSQCIERPSGTETFKNVTVVRGSKLGKTCAVTFTGTVNVQAGAFMDCTCP